MRRGGGGDGNRSAGVYSSAAHSKRGKLPVGGGEGWGRGKFSIRLTAGTLTPGAGGAGGAKLEGVAVSQEVQEVQDVQYGRSRICRKCRRNRNCKRCRRCTIFRRCRMSMIFRRCRRLTMCPTTP